MDKQRLRIYNYMNENNDNYFEVAELLSEYDYDFEYYSWSFRELFEELDAKYVMNIIDEFIGSNHKINLDDTYIEDMYGDFSKLTDYYYEFDFLDLEYYIENTDEEIIEDILVDLELE